MMKMRVRQHERGLWFRHGNFLRLLMPGTYRLWTRLWSGARDQVEVYNTLLTRFEHPLLDVLVAHPEVERALLIVDLADNQRALVWKDSRLVYVLGPGRHAFWRTPARLHVETFEIGGVFFEHAQREAILAHPQAKPWLDGVEVRPHEQVLFYCDGRLVRTLTEGIPLVAARRPDHLAGNRSA
jgi:hypothetical protein